MFNSDEDFDDDFVLDDQTLAILDKEESRFEESKRVGEPDPEDLLPPAKRQKLDPGPPLNFGVFSHSPDDTEDLPDITVCGDDTYGAELQRPITLTPQTALNDNVILHGTNVTKDGAIPSNNHTLAGEISNPRASLKLPIQSRHPTPSTTRPAPAPAARVASQPSRSQSVSKPHVADHSPAAASGVSTTTILEKHVAALRKQTDELRKDVQSMLSAKLAKEGENAILRKNIEKTAQDHAAQITKLRAAKEESEAKQTQMQKEMKEEAERLKTLYTFKQHEIETSTRKSPWSASSKKAPMAPPATPVPLPSQMQRWNWSGAVASPSRVVQESPTRPRFGEIANNERTRKPVVENRNLPSGFQPSASPTKSRDTNSRKGRVKAPAQFDSGPPPAFLPFGGAQTNPLQTAQDDGSGAAAQDDVFMADSNVDINFYSQHDVEMTDGAQDPQIQATADEEIEEVEPHRWIVDLHRLVLMHMEPTCKMTTFHALLGVSLPIGPKSVAYTSACSRVLDVLASVPAQEHQFWGLAAQTICEALIEMADVLAASHQITSLAALLSQLTQITYTLPAPHPYLLVDNGTDVEEDGVPRILAVICSTIQDYVSKLENHETEKSDLGLLAKESLALLEALCWDTPSDLENRLAFVPRCPSVLSILLDSSRPTWFLFQSTRMLSRFSTRPVLFQSLLSIPDTEGQSQDYTRLPHVERMCSLLNDSSRTGDEADGIKRHILTFFAMLSEAHPTAHAIIIESQSVIPSIIVYLYELSVPVWQGDEALESDPQAASRVIQRMNQTTFLLHHLMFKAEAPPRLRERLEHAPRHYNGLVHIFVVTMGRLSFADVPEWVQEEDKLDLERVAGLAKDLLELLMDAPQMDAIWATYQEGPDEEMEDDEEVEARRLAANVI
ncbi:hypothetical protein DEU56DRAFT_977750 [Suillus clintonianus]|uniref:uncharacterized protein n=1 Tax=Suillus clintonianus TaxID=1904413 RepID=UPI001B886EEA|nr:uncharacterized protein DEU56DRAFT_977750 [Suillus clintonianus]KAG2150466.1 hypothetical protein DEU56DRAFT_977750 [Suillus clintonianus]